MAGRGVAWYLAAAGVPVEVLERAAVGSGASWGNTGWVCRSHSAPIAAPGVPTGHERDEQLEGLLLTMLRAVGVQLDNSTRPPEAIAARLVRKLRREDPQPRVERALELLRLLA